MDGPPAPSHALSMIDLHYFAGLSTKQTAAALRLAPEVVIRDLRFAKAWLQTKLIHS